MMTVKIRPEVLHFAEAMEEKLAINDHKGGWDSMSMERLFFRMKDEIREMEMAVKSLAADILYKGQTYTDRDARLVRQEAADVANFCMMMAENCDRLAKIVKGDEKRRDRKVQDDEVSND